MRLLKISVAGIETFLTVSCDNRLNVSKECAEAAALELSLLKDKTNFPGNSDPVVQESGTEAWTAARKWKEQVCTS